MLSDNRRVNEAVDNESLNELLEFLKTYRIALYGVNIYIYRLRNYDPLRVRKVFAFERK